MTDEAKKHGFEVVAVSGEKDPARQYGQVKEFIVKKVSAIVLTPCDSKAVGAAIKEANAAGIPVFTADIKCLAPGAKVECHVATDNYAGGREAGRAMMMAIGNKGKVAILDYPEVESVLLRTKGFRDHLATEKSPIKIVGSWPGKGAKDDSFKAMQDVLTSHKDLAGVFAINDPSALGAYAAIEKSGLAGKIAIVGFDGQPEGKRAIKEGKIFADPIQFPERIGRETVTQVMKYLSGDEVSPELLIATKLYFKADAQRDPDLK
jgi:ribose transport system substrate-binding protein